MNFAWTRTCSSKHEYRVERVYLNYFAFQLTSNIVTIRKYWSHLMTNLPFKPNAWSILPCMKRIPELMESSQTLWKFNDTL